MRRVRHRSKLAVVARRLHDFADVVAHDWPALALAHRGAERAPTVLERKTTANTGGRLAFGYNDRHGLIQNTETQI